MPNRTCATKIDLSGTPCGHREVGDHAPPVPGVPGAPRSCRVPGCRCANFSAPAPAEPETTMRVPREERAGRKEGT